MSFGALLADQTGVPFYIADTMPISLIEKRVISAPASSGTDYALFSNDGAIRFVFVNSTGAQGGSQSTCEYMYLNTTNNSWTLKCVGAQRTVNAYIFGYQFQPIPAWGIQINDAQGRCILTNETKVLRDVQNLGDSTLATNSGYQFSTTISGEWAVAPVATGMFSGVNNSSGQPIPITAQFCSSARFNGSTTQIASGYIGQVDGSASNPSYANYRNRITAINVARY